MFGVDDNIGKPAVQQAGVEIKAALYLLENILTGLTTRWGGLKVKINAEIDLVMPPENPPPDE
jgi:hypothetical protein